MLQKGFLQQLVDPENLKNSSNLKKMQQEIFFVKSPTKEDIFESHVTRRFVAFVLQLQLDVAQFN